MARGAHGGLTVSFSRRFIASCRVGLVLGPLGLAGCATTPDPYAIPALGSDGGYQLGYGRPAVPFFGYYDGDPGYYGYPRYYGYYGSPGYGFQGYYGPLLYRSPPIHVHSYRDDHRGRNPGQRPPRDSRDRHDHDRDGRDRGGKGRDGADRDRRGDRGDRGGSAVPPPVDRQPRPGVNPRRFPPEMMPTESLGDAAPAPRSRGRRAPGRELPD